MSVPVPARHAKPGSPDTKPGTGTPDAANPGTGEKALYRIHEAMRLLSLSRSVIYNQIRAGRLRSVKEGSTRLIPADAIADYVALLKAEADAKAEAGR
jgi:excisionase family DNA binding protein